MRTSRLPARGCAVRYSVMSDRRDASVPRPHGLVLPPAAMSRRTAARLLAAALVFSVGGAVQEETKSYSCCEPLHFNAERQNEWSHNNMNFAKTPSINGEPACAAPCKNIKNEVMELEECVNVTLKEMWEHPSGSAMERRIHYLPQPCASSAAGNPGVAIVPLLALIITGFVMRMIC